MKKILSLVLSLCLFTTFTVGIYADELYPVTSESNISVAGYESHLDDISNDLDNLNSVGITYSLLSIDSIDKDDNVVYDFEVTDQITCQVTVNETVSGNLELNFNEYGLENTLTFLDDGRIFLDGSEVTVSADEVSYENLDTSEVVANTYSTHYSTTPYGTGYSVNLAEYRKNVISLGTQTLWSMGTGALATLLCTVINPLAGLAIPIGAVTAAATGLFTTSRTYGLNTAYLSCRILKVGKPSNTSVNSYFQYAGAYYIGKNLTGYKYYHDFYEYRYFN